MYAENDAAATLAELDRVSRRTQEALRAVWYPLVVFGALILGGGALASVLPGPAFALYWLFGYAAAFVAVARYYRRRARQLGVADDTRAYIRLWWGYPIVSIVATSIGANVGGDDAVLATSAAVICVAYLVLARLQRSLLAALVGVAIAAYGGVLALASPAHAWEIAYFGIGAVLVLTGLYARTREEPA